MEFQDLFHRQTPEPPQCHLLSKNREKYSVPVLILMLNYTYTLATVIFIFECESVNEFHTLKPHLCSVAGTHGNKHQSSNLGFEQNPFRLLRSNCRFLDRTTSHSTCSKFSDGLWSLSAFPASRIKDMKILEFIGHC